MTLTTFQPRSGRWKKPAGAADGLVVGVLARRAGPWEPLNSAGVPGQGLVDQARDQLGIVVGLMAGDQVLPDEQRGGGGLGGVRALGGCLAEQACRLHRSHEEVELAPEIRGPVTGIGNGSSQSGLERLEPADVMTWLPPPALSSSTASLRSQAST